MLHFHPDKNPGPSERRYLMSFNFHPLAMMDPHSPPLNPSLNPQATPPAMPSLPTKSTGTTVQVEGSDGRSGGNMLEKAEMDEGKFEE
ncbi:Hypothetical protein, putative [Bodo saltans]|uniref:Uncharacterized protein n=1 Tax=Bodo saltans TaxID=75058 RepID=A0A0S4JLA1_BODSA|nr:Hypothetical protein, putative [Bodo saltans]|eukprot:CUG90025.1 Hypothetical protein, putative [Bodo saltans]